MDTDCTDLKRKIEFETNEIRDKMQVELKAKLSEADERTAKESKALAAKLEAERNALAAKLETGNQEVAERMQKEEEQRRREADELKAKMENAKEEQGNSITQMFDRLKAKMKLVRRKFMA